MRKITASSALLAGAALVALAVFAGPGLPARADVKGGAEAFLGGEGVSGGESVVDAEVANLVGQDAEKIPFIAVFKGETRPDLRDFDVRHDYHLIRGVAATGSARDVDRLSRDDCVEGVYLDRSIQISENRSSLRQSRPVSPAMMVNADKVWAEGIDGSGVIVAVIDSGIDKNHPDLKGKVVGEVNFVKHEDTTRDMVGHGTFCAGLIAGSGTASGGRYMGVAPGARLLNVRVIDSDGSGETSDIIAGIEWALDNNADVLSMSLAGLNLGETNPPITMAADNAMDEGAVVCVASGNSG